MTLRQAQGERGYIIKIIFALSTHLLSVHSERAAVEGFVSRPFDTQGERLVMVFIPPTQPMFVPPAHALHLFLKFALLCLHRAQ